MSDKITISIDPPDFEYDASTLVMAFCPDATAETVNEAPYRKEDGRSYINILFNENSIKVTATGLTPEMLESSGDITGLDRPEVKNVLKQCLYKVLKEATGRTLPWGTLTGIRPVRIPFDLMEKGMSESQIKERLTGTYYITDKKMQLAMDVANVERELLSGFEYKNGYSLYVGIPFCPSICLYCTFPSTTVDRADLDAYLKGLEDELAFMADMYEQGPDTIYIGGGTPTVLSADRLDHLICFIEDHFKTIDVKEFTVEAGRPDTIDKDKLRVLKEHGISRISINPQTMNDKTLELIGRKHRVSDVCDAFYMARDLGFDNINMDTIVGLPGEGFTEMERTMEELISLGPENITVHSLAVKRAARLNLFKDKYKEMGMANSEEIMDMIYEKLNGAGMRPYYLYRQKNMAGNMENVGYSKPGYEGLYNVLIMEEKQTIIACGAGSSTKRVWGNGRIERIVNPKDVKTYLEGIEGIKKKKRKLLEED